MNPLLTIVAVGGGLLLLTGMLGKKKSGSNGSESPPEVWPGGESRWTGWWLTDTYKGHKIHVRKLQRVVDGYWSDSDPPQWQWKVDHWNPRGMYGGKGDASDAAKQAIDEGSYK